MGEGWIKLHRRFLDWEWFTTPNMVRLFTFLLVAANHEDGRWQGVEVKRGQLVTGRQSLSAKTGISERSIRTCLARLEQTGEITQKSTNKFSIITVCKYSDYQTADVANRPATDQQPTSNRPATDHKQEEEECKNERKDIVVQEPRQKESIPFSQIVSFLNEKAGTDYKPTTKATRGHIKARWSEGHRELDFYAVIESKCEEWAADAKMSEYLRPQTLFGTKFESYLQKAKNEKGNSQWR